MQNGIGDLSSKEAGTAARFNAGKPALHLVPAGLFAAAHAAASAPAGLGRKKGWVRVLYDLQAYQVRGDSKEADRNNLLSALVGLGDLAEVWSECAKVFDYGQRKYSQRGDCTCSAGNAARKILEGSSARRGGGATPSGGCVEGAMTWTSGPETQTTGPDRQPTTGSGLKTQEIASGRGSQSGSVAHLDRRTRATDRRRSTEGSRPTMALTETLTTDSWPLGAASAGQPNGLTWTTVTQLEKFEGYSAIPAILALDFSKGLTAGLSEHSPTCGVHKTPGMTGSWNWAKGQAWSVPLASALRHIVFGILAGETHDPESGETHRGHVACNIVMLLTYLTSYPEGDDRPYNLLKASGEAPDANRV